jgi:YggT family protein
VSLILFNIINAVSQFYVILIIIYILMSWFPVNGALYDVYRVIGSLVDPYVALFRRFIPPLGGLDFSAWAAILVLQFVIVPVLKYLVLLLVR